MKKFSLFFILAVFMASSFNSAYSQRHERNEDRYPFDIKDFVEKRNIYLTEKLSLTAEEVEKFLPIDNELMRKKFEIGRDCHQLGRKIRNKKKHTEEEYAALLKCREEVKAKRFELEKEYMEKFKEVLSNEKMILYESAAKDFLNEYMKDRRD
jgi:hypothetical protein